MLLDIRDNSLFELLVRTSTKSISLLTFGLAYRAGVMHHGAKFFTPKELIQKRELEFASRALPTIELNGSFYALQLPSSYLRWYEQTPHGFIFSIKATRYITHVLRLRNVEQPIANFFASGVLLLKEKLGPIL